MDIVAFWDAVLRQDERALPAFFSQDAVVRWHCSNERFTAAEFVRANCEYPGSWAGEMERHEDLGDLQITVMRVFPQDGTASFHVTSFFTLRDGRIESLDEYWADDGPAPAWRQTMGIGVPIR
ncbi:MAG: nuclear transport factor 2 family protein [Clostridiales bacterium]|nr:nuclear transport factor 2 family protein [Clostridiales bacterium]